MWLILQMESTVECRENKLQHVQTLTATASYPVFMAEDSTVTKCFPRDGDVRDIESAAKAQKVKDFHIHVC